MPVEKCEKTLAIICADLTTQSKVDFPEMSDLYFSEPDKVPPVEYVRASMSVPLFFAPYVLSMQGFREEATEQALWEKWKYRLGYEGDIPSEVVFVDGGILSNFPIDTLYFPDRILDRPIVGVKLGIDRKKSYPNKSSFQLMMNCLEGARNNSDFTFLITNPIFKDLVTYVDVGTHNWLNFRISTEDKLDLFRRGAVAAQDFIYRFNWPEYQQKVRKKLLRDALVSNSSLLSVDDLCSKFGLGAKDIHEKCTKLQSLPPKEILWIDDDYTNDALELIALQLLNLRITPVSSTSQARKRLESRSNGAGHPAFDLIITDSNRAGDPEEGLRFCRELSKDPRFLHIPVLMHSRSQEQNLATNRKDFPKNIRNSPDRNLLRIEDLIKEVLEVLG